MRLAILVTLAVLAAPAGAFAHECSGYHPPKSCYGTTNNSYVRGVTGGFSLGRMVQGMDQSKPLVWDPLYKNYRRMTPIEQGELDHQREEGREAWLRAHREQEARERGSNAGRNSPTCPTGGARRWSNGGGGQSR